MASNNLLQEFPPVSTQSWEETIRKDLKGADYTKKLIWQSEDGLAVKPYYRAEDIAGLECLDSAPGTFPYLRGTHATGDWRIREEIDADDPGKANQAALSAVAAGAEEIAFGNVRIKNASDLTTLLANLQEIPIHFQNADENLIRLLMERQNNFTGIDIVRLEPTYELGFCGGSCCGCASHVRALHHQWRGALKNRERLPSRKLGSRSRLASIFSRKCNHARWT